jgi:REP element-mobilizing transposase RayT
VVASSSALVARRARASSRTISLRAVSTLRTYLRCDVARFGKVAKSVQRTPIEIPGFERRERMQNKQPCYHTKQHCPKLNGLLDSFFVQRPLFPHDVQAELARTEHGGAVRRGCRKLERPVSVRRPMHVVLSSDKARGPWSLRKHAPAVQEALRAMAQRFAIRIYDFANVGSHLHLLVRARRRESFQAFLRSFAGIVARRVTGARRGRPCGRFFSGIAWSRVVGWGRDYLGVRHYVFRNQIEGSVGSRVRRAIEEGPVRTRHHRNLSGATRLSRAGPRSPSS